MPHAANSVLSPALALLLATVALPRLAAAASFDCTHAVSLMERIICGDPKLSSMDSHLRQFYHERSAALSPAGAALLQKSEQGWLHFISVACEVAAKYSTVFDNSALCLEGQYSQRLDDLMDVGAHIGPYVFNRVDLYTSTPAPDRESGRVPGFYYQHVAFPQIDSPASPAAVAWNKQAKKSLPLDGFCEGIGDDDASYRIKYANRDVISMLWTSGSYCHGTPHGMYAIRQENSVLAQNLRPLTDVDVFGSSADVSPALRKLFEQALDASHWHSPGPQTRLNLLDDMMRPTKWVFTPNGLEINFDEAEGGCYACNPRPITLPWAELKPLQKPGALLP